MRTALIVLGVAGAAAGVYFFVVRPRQQAAAAMKASSSPAPVSAVSTQQPVKAGLVDVGAVLGGDHVTRKNALAPEIASRFGVPTNISTGITSIAGKLSLSSYAQKYVTTKVPYVGAIAEAPITGVKKVAGFLGGLF